MFIRIYDAVRRCAMPCRAATQRNESHRVRYERTFSGRVFYSFIKELTKTQLNKEKKSPVDIAKCIQ